MDKQKKTEPQKQKKAEPQKEYDLTTQEIEELSQIEEEKRAIHILQESILNLTRPLAKRESKWWSEALDSRGIAHAPGYAASHNTGKLFRVT